MKKFHEIDANNVFMYTVEKPRPSYKQVAVPVPQIPPGMCAQWQSELNPKTDVDWGKDGTGAWLVVEDNRKAELYTVDGPYKLGEDVDGQTYNGIGPLLSWLSTDEPAPPQLTLEEAQAQRIGYINHRFEQAVAGLTDGYPEGERLTWPIQQSEALAWSADPQAATPYLDGLAAARGISEEEMRQKTLDQTLLFMQASQALVGERQRLRDAIYAALSIEEVELITWDV